MLDNNHNNHNSQNNNHPCINPKLQQRLQQLLTDLQLDDAPAGGALVVYQAGKCIAQVSIGMAQPDMLWQPDTLSLNFSTGKGVLATLVHVLVSQQLLDYDLPIADYWPAFAANGKADICLRAVLSHQANLFAITAIDADSEALLDWTGMLAKVAAMPTSAPEKPMDNGAGSYHSAYSALVYGWILGGLIEAVTDMSLAEALRYYLTEPLGIADSCYFGVPADKVNQVAKLVKNFEVNPLETPQSASNERRAKRHKPVLKPDSAQTLHTYNQLPSYDCWQQQAVRQNLESADAKLNATQINRLYFNHSQLNLKNYKAALIPIGQQPIDYYDQQTLQAVIPAANGVASAQALATIYAMLANGGEWQGKTLINQATFRQLSMAQVSGMDAVMPTNMNWRLGYHRLFQICADSMRNETKPSTEQGFGHMGYNGSVAWCDPAQRLSFAFVHNFDVTMLNDIRQFALTEALLSMLYTDVSV